MLAFATGIHKRHLIQPVCLADTTSSMLVPIPRHIILAMPLLRAHHLTPGSQITTNPLKSLGRNQDFSQTTFHLFDFTLHLAVRNTISTLPVLSTSPPLRDILIHRLEENRALTANLILQCILDKFAHIPEESDTILLHRSLFTIVSSTVQLSVQSVPIDIALLKNKSIQWISLVLRFCLGISAGMFMTCSGCRFTLYCSRTCQKNDWSSGNHRPLCAKIRQLRNDTRLLPTSLSDRRAIENLNSQYLEYHKQKPSEWDDLLDEYIAENGEPFWPLVLVLDYRALNVEPDIQIESSQSERERGKLETGGREAMHVRIRYFT
ncbi:uncharacterized protein BT62DRAFT_1073363 [Guyanagaster necrorhizus]|uniref:MYND-type domain-containing protein n=1 Tax=Guyanagaster necrorhizus TaxID=856835 RepID=A0A9P8AXI1_9AGAR|nr:uncharacterized protein BT62DRAFT_1073363 [Guyanagaster necrorhizus MCA 3950]KAG7449962.1 hypothetical protein BT62DRAFT_1073363 [Guyanagaster necrorhizus MCA 3950]